MKIANLRVFLAIYDTRSVSLASRVTGISQSGASAALSRLRGSFSDELFVKSRRGMEPTARAHAIAGPARQLIEAADQLTYSKVKFDPMTSRDEFRFVSGDILESTLLISLVKAFKESAPHARLISVSMKQGELEPALAAGTIDACFGSFENLGSNINQTSITKFSFACFCNPNHPLADKKITMAEFSSARYALMEADCSLPNVIESWFKSREIDRNIVVRTAHFQGITRLLLESDLISIVPTDPGQNWLFAGKVSKIELPFDLPTSDLQIYWHHIFQNDPRNRWFRRLAVKALRQETIQLQRNLARPTGAIL